MGLSLDEVFIEGRLGLLYRVTIVSNQDNGVASYAQGVLNFYPGGLSIDGRKVLNRFPRLSTTGQSPAHLSWMFSDRTLFVGDPPPPGQFPNGLQQPFSVRDTVRLGVSISRPIIGMPVAKLTALDWGDVTFTFALESRGRISIGVGPAIGGQADHAVYLMSFESLGSGPK